MALSYQPTGIASRPTISTQTLLGQVLGLTGIGLLVTAIASYLFQNLAPGSIFGWAAVIGTFILIFVINGVRQNEALAMMLYYVFTFLMGIWIAPVVGQYVHAGLGSVVTQAATTTGLGMLALGAIVYGTGLDLRRFQGILMLATLGLVLVGIVSIFVKFMHPTTFAWITLVIFSAWTLIDFARIRAGGDGYTPVQMALQLYLDAINIFLALLQIFGNRSRDD